jgi:hypothetical protein
LDREKNQVKEESYNSACENVTLIKAQIENLQKELLSKKGTDAVATAEQSKALLLSREIRAINEKYDLKKREYKSDDYKNLNWIEVLREKEIKKTKKRIKLISPVEASMQYKEKLEKKIESLIEKKKEYLKELEAASQQIQRSDAKLTDWWIVALVAFLSALGFTYFSYRINKLKGDAKAEYETGLKMIKTRIENAKTRENGETDTEELSPLMKRMQEMKARQQHSFDYVTPENAPEEGGIENLFQKIYDISIQIGEYNEGDLQKASLDDLKYKGLQISDHAHRKVIAYGVESGKLFQKQPRGAYYFKKIA